MAANDTKDARGEPQQVNPNQVNPQQQPSQQPQEQQTEAGTDVQADAPAVTHDTQPSEGQASAQPGDHGSAELTGQMSTGFPQTEFTQTTSVINRSDEEMQGQRVLEPAEEG